MLKENNAYFFAYNRSDAEVIAPSPSVTADRQSDCSLLPTITRCAELELYVETPLVAACKILYEKNIRIMATSIDEESLQSTGKGWARILVSWDDLSEENQAIAETLVGRTAVYKYDTGTALEMRFPITVHTPSKELEVESCLVSQAFYTQAPNFKSFRLEELRRNISPSLDESYLIRNMGFVYDREEERFYLSLEQWQVMHPNEKPSNRRIRYKGQWARNRPVTI